MGVLIIHLDKNFSYVILVSVFLTGHFLFVNVYDDKYSIQETTKNIDVKKEAINWVKEQKKRA